LRAMTEFFIQPFDAEATISDPENIHFSELDLDAEEGDDFRGWLMLSVLALGVMFFAAYFVITPLGNYFGCPAGTLMSGPTAWPADIAAALLLLPASYILMVCTGFEGAHNKFSSSIWLRRNLAASVAVGASAFILNAAVIANMTLSYYCVTPSEIVVGPGIFGSRERVRWDDVKLVHAYCWQSAPRRRFDWGARSGGLLLRLANGRTVTLNWEMGLDFSIVRSVLAGRNYQFETSNLVRCPSHLYELFTHWQTAE
jgi:hypothetical protein